MGSAISTIIHQTACNNTADLLLIHRHQQTDSAAMLVRGTRMVRILVLDVSEMNVRRNANAF